ncbi:hypothetical protein BH23THE1_BH23THE1_05810 [soil metagenome]
MKIHDGKMLRKLVNYVLDRSDRGPHKTKINSLIAEGAYDSNPNFRHLVDKKIKPGIKVRQNSVVLPKNYRLRNNKVAIRQTKDILKWKKKRKCGCRWMAEPAFSSIKRMFGEHVSATRFEHMVKEMMVKVSRYNLLRRI